MKRVQYYFKIFLIPALLLCAEGASSQMRGDSWKLVKEQGYGTVTALWDDIEPFIYTTPDQQLRGVEYEIMLAFKDYLASKHGVQLSINWARAGSFDSIYSKVKNSHQPGFFGWSYYSITPAREKEVVFSLPYMPDLNVLITNNREPMYATPQEFTSRLSELTAYTQSNTTMQEDVFKLKMNFFPALSVKMLPQDYEILKQVERDQRSFAYVPLSIYIVALQKGIKVKRQLVLSSKREGFAALMPIGSDWKPVLDEFMMTDGFRATSKNIIAKYLGSQVRDLVFSNASVDAQSDSLEGVELVSLEKEIVIQRLMASAVELQRHRSYQNIVIVALIALVTVLAVLYNRYRTKKRLSKSLAERNEWIQAQRDQIAEMNQLLQLKILQTRLNPHFLFNSLNAIQYFVMGDDKSTTLRYIGRFASFLRKVIEFGDEVSISAANEKTMLEEYLWLERCRFQDRFDYEVNIMDTAGSCDVLPLISLTLVEQALYKGILANNGSTSGKIVAEFSNSADKLEITVTDNGAIRAGDTKERPQMLVSSVEMLEKRLTLFNSRYPERIIWDKGHSTPDGFTISTLTLPRPLFDSEKSYHHTT